MLADFNLYYLEHGIWLQLTVARTPHQNGVVEHKNMTLLEAARALYLGSTFCAFLWQETIWAVIYVLDRCATRALHLSTPSRNSTNANQISVICMFWATKISCSCRNNHNQNLSQKAFLPSYSSTIFTSKHKGVLTPCNRRSSSLKMSFVSSPPGEFHYTSTLVGIFLGIFQDLLARLANPIEVVEGDLVDPRLDRHPLGVVVPQPDSQGVVAPQPNKQGVVAP